MPHAGPVSRDYHPSHAEDDGKAMECEVDLRSGGFRVICADGAQLVLPHDDPPPKLHAPGNAPGSLSDRRADRRNKPASQSLLTCRMMP